MVEFKQIVGRGTRLFDGKDYFTIYDFTKAHRNFLDPEWDGPPEAPDIPEDKGEKPPCNLCGQKHCVCEKSEPSYCEECQNDPCVCDKPFKQLVRVKLSNGKALEIDATSKTTFWSPDGKPISATEFIQQLFGELPEFFSSEDELRKIWSLPDTRKKLLTELEEKGFSKGQLEDLKQLVRGEDSDLFDVLSFISFHKNLIPRKIRADKAKMQFSKFSQEQQKFLDFVLKQYVQNGVYELDDEKLPELLQLKYRAIADAKRALGEIKSIRDIFIGFQKDLYGDEIWLE
jgi:type I restriction enzyme R subunit